MAYDNNHVPDWDNTTPDGSTAFPSSLDDAIREIKRCIETDLNPSVVNVTADYTCGSADGVLLVNPTIGDITVTLLSASGSNQVRTIINIGTAGYNVIIDPASGESIDGESSFTLGQFESLTLKPNTVDQYHRITPYMAGVNVGTKMFFHQDTAPFGWSIVSGFEDSLLGVKGGSNALNGTGGTQVGTWTQPNHQHNGPSHSHSAGTHTHTINGHDHTMDHYHPGGSHTHAMQSHTHSTANHTLTIAEMPSHNHSGSSLRWAYEGSDSGATCVEVSSDTYEGNMTAALNIASQGGGGAHNHGNTGGPSSSSTGGASGNTGSASTSTTSSASLTTNAGSGDTGSSGTGYTTGNATADTWRPQTAIGIIAQRDHA